MTLAMEIARSLPRPGRRPGRLTDDQVLDILTSAESDSAVARRYSRSREFIGQVRTGRCYANVHPEIERREKGAGKRTCTDCVHHYFDVEGRIVKCRLEIPEAEQLGAKAAQFCSAYMQSTK